MSTTVDTTTVDTTTDITNGTATHSIGYSKIHLLGLFALYDIDRVDVAVVLAAIEKVDSSFSQRVDIDMFAELYVKDWGWVFILVWENYYELLHGLKEPLVQESGDKEEEKDTTDTGYDADEKDIAEAERLQHLLEHRRRPEYFVFLGFLFFIVSITDREELSRLVFWIWYVRSRSKAPATLDTLIDIIPVIWGKKPAHKKLAAKLAAKVKKGSKRLDMDEFDAAKFHVLDFASKGAWTRPIMKMQEEIKWRFAKPMVWYRIVGKVHSTFKTDIDVALDRLDCPRRKKGVKAYGDKGERRVVRQYVRRYLKLITNFLEVPRGEELDVKRMNTLVAYAWPLVQYVGRLVVRAKKGLGLKGGDEQVHPSVDAVVARGRDGGDGGGDGDEQKQKKDGGMMKEGKRRATDRGGDDDDVDDAKKYRHALRVNVNVLNDRAMSAKEKARLRIQTANDCVFDDFDIDISLLVKTS